MAQKPRTASLSFTVTPNEKRQIEAKADRAGLTLSAYVRQVTAEAVEEGHRGEEPMDRVLGPLRQVADQVASMAAMTKRGLLPEEEEVERVFGQVREVLDLLKIAMEE